MEENKSKNLFVSDCHTAGFEEIGKNPTVDEEFEGKGKYICSVCRQPCKVVEMIVDDIQASEEGDSCIKEVK